MLLVKPLLTRFLVSVIVLVELGESTTSLSLEAEVQDVDLVQRNTRPEYFNPL